MHLHYPARHPQASRLSFRTERGISPWLSVSRFDPALRTVLSAAKELRNFARIPGLSFRTERIGARNLALYLASHDLALSRTSRAVHHSRDPAYRPPAPAALTRNEPLRNTRKARARFLAPLRRTILGRLGPATIRSSRIRNRSGLVDNHLPPAV